MTAIRVTTLGGLCIERDGAEVRDLPAQPVRCALFLYLAVERSATRDALCELFWPDRDSDRARHSLRQTLYELRRRLGADWLDFAGETARVLPCVEVDVLVFAAAIAAGDDDRALALYRGPFLPGFHAGELRSFEEWVDRLRTRHCRLHRDLCRRLSARTTGDGDAETALAIARRWVDTDPLEDEAQHRLIELLAVTGRRAEALRQADSYTELIARELNVVPLDETRALVARIRAGDPVAVPVPTAAAGTPASAPNEVPASNEAAAPGEGAAQSSPTGHAATPGMAMREPEPPLGRLTRGPRTGRFARAALAALVVLGLAGAAQLRRGAVANMPPPERMGSPDAMGAAGPEGATGTWGGADEGRNGIAVLPFMNMSPDPEQEYFSDGITEDLLTSLSRIEGLRVISRTSVWGYKGRDATVPEIARELGVRYILEGSVRREGDAVRITAQLIDAREDAHLWSATYDRRLPGVFEIQGEIAERIAGALHHRLAPSARERIVAGSTTSPVAYDLLLRGREFLNRPGSGDVRKFPPAVSFFHRALEVDPGYARAYAGLSDAFRQNIALPPPLAIDSALWYAHRAVAADPELAEAAAALGGAYTRAGRPDAAGVALRRALVLDPNHSEALAGMARLAALEGRLDEAVRWQRRAGGVDPAAAPRWAALGEYLFDLGDLAGAEQAFERAVDFAPDYLDARYLLAQVQLLNGDSARADATMRGIEEVAADHSVAALLLGRYHVQRARYDLALRHLERPRFGAGNFVRAFVLRRTGDSGAAHELVTSMLRTQSGLERRQVPLPPRPRLFLAALAGDSERVIELLDAHWRTGLRGPEPDPPELGVYFLDAEPLLSDLLPDPRFRATLARMRAGLDSMRAQLAH